MKNYLTAFLCLFLSSAVFSQTQKGKIVLSGNTDLSFLFTKIISGTDSVQTGKTNSEQYAVSVGGGYFIADNISVGITGSYSYNYTNIQGFGNTPKTITTSYTILPQFQYYIPVEGKLRPFAAVGAGYAWMEERDSRITDNHNRASLFSGAAFVGGAGVSYFITPSVAFDLGLQYTYSKLQDKLRVERFQKLSQFAGRIGVSVFL